MIVCPNTSPLIVLARVARLDLLGDPSHITVTRAVLAEIHDKRDDVSARVDGLVSRGVSIVEPPVSDRVDLLGALGPGERSVLSLALGSQSPILCLLDDQAARSEARRLRLTFTGTLGLVLRARLQGKIERAGLLLRDAVEAGLYLDDGVLRRALAEVGEPWPPA
jgi:predicted nucleic acid-binding protein